MSDGAFIRISTIGEDGRARSKRRPPTEETRARAQHITAINRAGNLVNQGIHALNVIAAQAPEAASRDRLADEIASTRELLQSAIATLKTALAAAISDDVREG